MKTFNQILNEGWNEKDFISQTHPIRRKFKDGDKVIIKKNSDVWTNDGWRSNFKKEKLYSQMDGTIVGLNKSKSKSNMSRWYDVKYGSSTMYIADEKDIVSASEAEDREKDAMFVFIYLSKLLGAHGTANEKEVKLRLWQVFRKETCISADVKNIPNYSEIDLNKVAEFFSKEEAESFSKDCEALLKKYTVAPLAMKEKKDPRFVVKESFKSFSYDEAVALSQSLDANWSVDKAKHEVRGMKSASDLGIV